MTLKLTPGIRYLSRLLLVVSVPPVVSALLSKYLDLPTWTVVATSALALPAFVALRITYKEIRTRKRAASLGARLAPKTVLKGWPANIDILVMMMENQRTGYPGDGLWEFTARYGPVWNPHVLWSDLIFTTNPEHIQRILATDFKNFVKGERFRSAMHSVLGVGVFNSDDEMWKFHRSMTRPFFSRDRITHFELFDRHAEDVIKQIKKRMKGGLAIDFQDLMGRFTLDTATEFLFGSSFHTLNASLPYPHHFSRSIHYLSNSSSPAQAGDDFASAFYEAQEIISNRERMGDDVWPLFEILEDRTDRHMKVVGGYVERVVEEALARKKKAVEEGKEAKRVDEVEEDETLLDHLVKITDDPTVLRDETLNILLAGRDTTAATLTFCVYLLSMHPHVLSKLRAEIEERIGLKGKLRFEDIKECRYLRAVINETLRLFPIVPFNVREAVKETTWPSPDPDLPPIYIPAGTKVSYSVFMMHRRKDLWGPDAEIFDPERFLDDRLKKYLAPNPFIFLPFNAGPRICLGQQFAYNEMSLMIIRLVQNFSSFTYDEEACPPEWRARPQWREAIKADANTCGQGYRKATDRIYPKMTLTMSIAGGMWIKATEGDNVGELV